MLSTTQSSTHPQFLSVDEFAAVLGMNPRTIRRHIESGELPAFRVGKLLKIEPTSALRAMLKPANPSAERLLTDDALARADSIANEAPPLTAEQADKLRALLSRGGNL